MLVYILLIFAVMAVSMIDIKIHSRRNVVNSVLSNTVDIVSAPVRPSWFATILIIALLTVIAGWRSFVGTDYSNYIDCYTVFSGWSYADAFKESEPLFTVLNIFVKDVFDNYIGVFAISGFLTVVCLVLSIRYYSSNFSLSVYLMFTSMVYFSSFNGVRQRLAAMIIMLAYPLIRKKKYVWLLIVIFIASLIHASSIYMIAFILFSYTKAWSKFTGITISCFMLAFVFYQPFAGIIFKLLETFKSTYTSYETELTQTGFGANALRFIFLGIPVILSYIFYDSLKKTRPDIDILINFSLLNSLFMFLAIRHWLFARFNIFLDIFNILLWPEIIKVLQPKEKVFIGYIVTLVFFIYMCLMLKTESNLLPYKSWLWSYVSI
ncbi:MAG: EpsG family protein [Oscillospiraceae bacterium]|nr:EpsG family protein [Oscillospiraceae bacterium]